MKLTGIQPSSRAAARVSGATAEELQRRKNQGVMVADYEALVAEPLPTKTESNKVKRKAYHLIACDPESEIRRNDDGSIHIAFYRERAQRLRREATIELWSSIREFSRAWF